MYIRFGIAVTACLIAGACSSIWDRQGEQTSSPIVESADETTRESTAITVPEGTASQSSNAPEGSESATAGHHLGEVGHVAALGEPDTSQFTPDYWLEGREETAVQIYVCAPPGKHLWYFDERDDRHTMSDPLHESVFVEMLGDFGGDSSSTVVRRFLLRESSGLFSVHFSAVNFAVLSPQGMDWRNTTMRSLYDDAVAGEQSACDQAALKRHGNLCPGAWSDAACLGKSPSELGNRILLLVDAPVDGVAGYADYGGIARVSLQAAGGRLGSEEFAFTVAHELGHSILQLRHTDDADGANCDDDKWALMQSGKRCSRPRMSSEGLLDYEITCAERKLIGWRCEHEPVSDEWLDFMDNMIKTAGEALVEIWPGLFEEIEGGTYSCPQAFAAYGLSGQMLDAVREYLTMWDQWPNDSRFWDDDHAADRAAAEETVEYLINQQAYAGRLVDGCFAALDPNR